MQPTDIPTVVFNYFAADPCGPMWNLRHLVNDPDCAIASALDSFLADIDPKAVASMRSDPNFPYYAKVSGKDGNLDRVARACIAERRLWSAISSRRIHMLRHGSGAEPSSPYDQAALADLPPDDEDLVPLRAFDLGGSRLIRNDHTFAICNTKAASNSTYWLLQSCRSEEVQRCARVRLDPLMHSPLGAFDDFEYMMLVYGRPLDWNRIDRLRNTEHGRWRPEEMSRERWFTDYVWKRRGDEVHFLCEEVPTVEQSRFEAARYAHAIYVPARKAISHLDFALRIYTESEIVERHTEHLRRAGKMGCRTKVFRIDRDLPRQLFSTLCKAFFVWNEDVSQYFDEGGTGFSAA